MSLGRRQIPQIPDHTIDVDGVVRDDSGLVVPPCVRMGAYGVSHLTVRIDEKEIVLWRLISHLWHHNALLLPRDGSYLNVRRQNLFPVTVFTGNISDPAMLQGIWKHHRTSDKTVRQIQDALELRHCYPDDIKTAIADMLVASIR